MLRLNTHTRRRRAPYAPDGSRIAFTVQEEGCQELYTVAIGGGPLTQVTFAGADFVRVASWSPDGAAIFFTSSLGRAPVPASRDASAKELKDRSVLQYPHRGGLRIEIHASNRA